MEKVGKLLKCLIELGQNVSFLIIINVYTDVERRQQKIEKH